MVRAIPIYNGYKRQRGYGIGGLLKGFLKRGAISVGRRVLQAGADALNQASTTNVSLKDALKQQAKKQAKSAIANVINSNPKKQASIKKKSSVQRRPSKTKKVNKTKKIKAKTKKTKSKKNKSKQIVL